MLEVLLPLVGKIKQVYDYLNTNWTTARAAKVDFLDATVSTRAPASTAVSNADYTAGKAVFIDSAISGRLGSIKAIYASSITISSGSTSNTATITAVVLARTIVIPGGLTCGGGAVSDMAVRLRMTSTTVLTADRAGSSGDCNIAYTIVEFNA